MQLLGLRFWLKLNPRLNFRHWLRLSLLLGRSLRLVNFHLSAQSLKLIFNFVLVYLYRGRIEHGKICRVAWLLLWRFRSRLSLGLISPCLYS